MHQTKSRLEHSNFPALSRQKLTTLQINLGYLCNLSCLHCHVNASPKRTELMDKATIDTLLKFSASAKIETIDLTGGAPEMNPHFRYLVKQARQMGIKVIDRCNLVILEEAGYQDLAEFLAEQQVEVIASLPCYLEENVDAQRGKGTFDASIKALKRLNKLGYGTNQKLPLNLVFNPQDAVLPPEQSALETAYKKYLKQHYGIYFNQLFAIVNMPIKRFGSTLISQGKFDDYMQLLQDSFNARTLDKVMCLSTLSVDWQGYVYDCDFNQMLELPLGATNQARTHISKLSNALENQTITVKQHCYGCTAGQGSSCGGAL